MIHGVLRTGATVPLVEEKRVEGRGNEYLIRQFFNTRTVPHSVSVLSTYRAARIKDVRA